MSSESSGDLRHTGRRRFRRSLRRRVALVFAAAIVATALVLSLSAYFITKSESDSDALAKALSQSRLNLSLASRFLPETPQASDYTSFLQALEIRGDFSTLIVADSQYYVSGPEVDRSLVSSELAQKVSQGRVGYQTVAAGSGPVIIVGGFVRSPQLKMYFFYPQADRLASLRQLRNILLIVGFVLAILGAIGGYFLGRRLVSPIGAAASAAEKMAAGDLSIRLKTGRDEFGVLAGSYNAMAENLQAKMADLEAGQARERRFVADVAHELRTPVSALVGEASLLGARLEADRESCSPEVAHLVELVGTDTGRLRQLVDDLLEMGRLDASAADVLMDQVDVSSFIRRLVEVHGWSHLVVLAEGPDVADLQIQSDRRRLERIIVNLIENALGHGRPPVEITLRKISTEGSLAIEVLDHGPGIPEQDIPKVFDRFYKADQSRSRPGTGLGLAIALANARLLGGDLTASNSPRAGALFTLRLPIR